MSGWKSKKMMSDSRFNISYSWTQPYAGWTKPVNTEMAVIEAVDNIVNSMTSYPEAEKLLAKIFSPK